MALRYRRIVALALLVLNISGVRVVAVSEACAPSRVFFGPAAGFRAMAKAVLRHERKQHHQRSLGAKMNRHSSRDVDFVNNERRVAFVTILPPINVALGTERPRNRPLYAWRLPRDLHPVQPPQLQSKK